MQRSLTGTVVAGGNGHGQQNHQLFEPMDVAVAPDGGIFVADRNQRVMHWAPNARAGTVVASRHLQQYDSLGFLQQPFFGRMSYGTGRHSAVAVAADGGIFVADNSKHRIMHWPPGALAGIIVAGGHGEGRRLDQFIWIRGLAIAPDGGIFVADAAKL